MGVYTTADKKRDEAKDHISEAYKCLLEALNPDTYGASDFREDYIEIMEEAALTLSKLKRKL